jgi:hypothetical protein
MDDVVGDVALVPTLGCHSFAMMKTPRTSAPTFPAFPPLQLVSNFIVFPMIFSNN